jgi:hypothetical protein
VQYLDGSAITNKKDKWEIQPDVEDHNTSNIQKVDNAGTAKTR